MFTVPPVDLEQWHAQASLWLYQACDSDQVDGYRELFEQRQALTAAMMRTAAALHTTAPAGVKEFIGDDLALAMGVAPLTGKLFVQFAVEACALPGLVETMERGELTEAHVRVVVRELDKTLATPEERADLVTGVLARAAERGNRRGYVLTPYELGKLVCTLVLLHDIDAAQKRRDKATEARSIFGAASRDGQGYLNAEGPVEQIAAMLDAIRARADAMAHLPGDTRTHDQRMFDACYDLLTTHADGGALPTGQPVRGVQVQVIVPFSILNGHNHEVAEIPGFGPILPATARDLTTHADTLRRVCINPDGHVTAVDDPTPGPAHQAQQAAQAQQAQHAQHETSTAAPAGPAETAAPHATDATPTDATPTGGTRSAARVQTPPDVADFLRAALHKLATDPIVIRDLSSPRYRIPGRISRFVKTRDRTCVFPGCSRQARFTDDDHREPWPAGNTDTHNLQCLCRHHHRAKQACFRVIKLPNGTYRWTTRTGHTYDRPPQGF